MKCWLLVLPVALALTGCPRNPRQLGSYGEKGSNSALAAVDTCSTGGFSRFPFVRAGFVVGATYDVRVATLTDEAPTLRAISDTIRIVTDSRVKLPMDDDEDVHTWVFAVEAVSAGDAELAVERGGTVIDTFPFNTRDAATWTVDERTLNLRLTETRTLELRVHDENGVQLAHDERPTWRTGSLDVASLDHTPNGLELLDLSSITATCATLRTKGQGATTIEVSSPVGDWSFDVIVEL